MTGMGRQGRTRLLASGLLIVTFGVGCLVGATSERLQLGHEASAAKRSETRKQPDRDSNRGRSPRGSILEPRFLDEIGTTPEQRRAINAILDQREQYTKRMWQDWEERFDEAMKQTRGEIRLQLSAEQIKKLDQAISERRVRRRQSQPDAPRPAAPVDSTHKMRI